MALNQLMSVKDENKRLNYELSKLRRKHSQEMQAERDKVVAFTYNLEFIVGLTWRFRC